MFEKYFGYSSPSNMHRTLNVTRSSKENKAQVNTTENRLANLMEVLESNPTSDAKKIKNRNNMLEIVNLFFTLIN